MAFTSVSRGYETGFSGRIATFFATLRDNRLRYRMFRQTVRELNGLSDRELTDLGLHRSGIDSVALEAAYGK